MAATQRFQLLVEAQARGDAELTRLSATVNKLTDELARANKKIADDAVKNQVRYSDAMKRIQADTEKSVGGASKATGDGAAGLGRYATAALGAYAAIKTVAAGFDSFVRGAGEAALEIKSLALSTGLSVGQADKLRAAANLTGFDIRNLKEAALDLSVALKDTGGQGDQTRQLLKQLGVSAYTSTGQTRQLNDVLLETFDALSKVQDTTQRVNLSRVLGGEDAAKNVQPLLAGYREANQLAEQIGFGTRDGLLKALDDSNKQLRAFDLQWEIIKGKLAEKIAPVVVPILFQTGKVLSGQRLPGSDVADFVLNAAGFATEGISADSLSRFSAKVPAGLTDFSSASQGGARFRNGQSGSEDSLKLRADQIQKDRASLISALSSDSLSDSARSDLSKKLNGLASESVDIARKLAFIQKARAGAELVVNSSDLINANIGAGITVGRVPSLNGNRGQINADGLRYEGYAGASVQVSQKQLSDLNPDTGISAAQNEGERQKAQRERELNTSFARQFVSFEERRIELLTGPGGELDAINKIYDLKKAGLEQELEFGGEIFNLTERRLQLEQERTLRILDLQRQRRDEARGLASDFVGSLQSGRPQDFFRQQGGRLINQIGTNALTGTFQRVQSTLGGIGAASGLGGLLKGTLLDPSNATPIDKNTLATERNTAALERVSVGGFSAGTGSAMALPSGFNAIAALGPASGLFGQSAYGKVAQIAGGAASALAPGGLFAGARSGSIQLGNGSATTAEGLGLTTTASRTANIAGSTASIGVGALTAYRGFKQGGVAGISQGITAALGTAALIPGPQQPFIAAAAATAALVSMLLPDPKKARDAAINREIQDAYYAENAPMSFSMDRFGRGYDYNKRGDMRGVPVTININALDSRSITDNRESIADAVRMAVYEGHGLNRAMQEAVGAAA